MPVSGDMPVWDLFIVGNVLATFRLNSSSLISNYYPTSTLGDNLSTSSGTWVVVKSKIEKVPRDIRRA